MAHAYIPTAPRQKNPGEALDEGLKDVTREGGRRPAREGWLGVKSDPGPKVR